MIEIILIVCACLVFVFVISMTTYMVRMMVKDYKLIMEISDSDKAKLKGD